MLLTNLYSTAKSVTQFTLESNSDPHFKFVIPERTRGVSKDGHKFSILCVKVTQGTHLRPEVWLEQLLKVKEELGQTNRKLFRRQNLRTAELCKFKDNIYWVIERMQATTELIPPEVDAGNEYSLPQSPTRLVGGPLLQLTLGGICVFLQTC